MSGDAAWRLLCFPGLFGDVAAVAPGVEADRGLILSHLPRLSRETMAIIPHTKGLHRELGAMGAVCALNTSHVQQQPSPLLN